MPRKPSDTEQTPSEPAKPVEIQCKIETDKETLRQRALMALKKMVMKEKNLQRAMQRLKKHLAEMTQRCMYGAIQRLKSHAVREIEQERLVMMERVRTIQYQKVMAMLNRNHETPVKRVKSYFTNNMLLQRAMQAFKGYTAKGFDYLKAAITMKKMQIRKAMQSFKEQVINEMLMQKALQMLTERARREKQLQEAILWLKEQVAKEMQMELAMIDLKEQVVHDMLLQSAMWRLKEWVIAKRQNQRAMQILKQQLLNEMLQQHALQRLYEYAVEMQSRQAAKQVLVELITNEMMLQKAMQRLKTATLCKIQTNFTLLQLEPTTNEIYLQSPQENELDEAIEDFQIADELNDLDLIFNHEMAAMKRCLIDFELETRLAIDNEMRDGVLAEVEGPKANVKELSKEFDMMVEMEERAEAELQMAALDNLKELFTEDYNEIADEVGTPEESYTLRRSQSLQLQELNNTDFYDMEPTSPYEFITRYATDPFEDSFESD